MACTAIWSGVTLPNGVPRAQTFSNVFAIIDPDLFKDCLISHLGTLQPALRDQAIDHFDFALHQLDLSKAKGWSTFQEPTAQRALDNWLFKPAGSL